MLFHNNIIYAPSATDMSNSFVYHFWNPAIEVLHSDNNLWYYPGLTSLDRIYSDIDGIYDPTEWALKGLDEKTLYFDPLIMKCTRDTVVVSKDSPVNDTGSDMNVFYCRVDYDGTYRNDGHIDIGPLEFLSGDLIKRGDLNGDGSVDVVDLMLLVNHILDDAAYREDYDLNNNGSIDITDIMALVNIILGV